MSPLTSPPQAEVTASFELFAPHYDAFTDHPNHCDWFRRLEGLARRHGLAGGRALDVGCGTGKSALVLAELGYEVVGCEPCAPMLERAQLRLGERAQLVHASAEALPRLGSFDYVSCVNDVCNYILDPERLGAAFAAVAANLADGGIFLFDANTPVTYYDFYAKTHYSESPAGKFIWHGAPAAEFEPGGCVEATIEIFEPASEDGLWRHHATTHVQRHHEPDTIARLLNAAGLRIEALYGQTDAGPPEQPVEPDRHTKAIYITKHA